VHLDEIGLPVVEIPILSHEVLAKMVGTTRPQINLFTIHESLTEEEIH
jgi:hypothetical protein